ncbi:glycosyltransferase [Streptomyces sp. NPDC035033]|uniref:glycosyltransferase n=1 Tax=Streptomyces sp. NPDC035033 TaxID=3155368 RepID=UPI0033F7593D
MLPRDRRDVRLHGAVGDRRGARLHRHRPDARLLVGGGSAAESAPLLALAERCGITDHVHLHDSVPHDETALYYSAADVTAVPSHYVPFGLVAVESMACGTPVVATRVGGLAWTVGDERLGSLVPPHDPDALAHALLTVLDRGREHYRAACLEQVAARFTAGLWTSGILTTYRSAVDEGSRAGTAHTPAP